MNIMQSNKIHSITLTIALLLVLAVLAGCERDEETVDTAETQPPASQPAEEQPPADQPAEERRPEQPAREQRRAAQPADEHGPLEHVIESDGYTLRANIGRTENLPETMARQYGIERDSDLVLLNVVVLDNRSEDQPVPVSADISAQIESLSGHVETIDLQETESDGHVSYIGTLDASSERSFQIHIEAQPEGAVEPLHMQFDVNLEAFDNGDSE